MDTKTTKKIKSLGHILTAQQIAEVLEVSHPTVLKWVSEGKLKSFSPGPRSHRFFQEEVLRFIEEFTGVKADDRT